MQQRLFEITYLLTERETMTAAELAERFGVSRRTIYRDIDALSAAGIPVYAQKGKGGGIRLLPGFTMDRSLFTQEERTQLVAHFQSLAAIETPDTAAILEKLGVLFGRMENWLEVDFSPWGGREEEQVAFRLLREAILSRRVVRFLYMGAGNPKHWREAEPYKIIFRGQGWYLFAFSPDKNDFRFFKLNRMQAPSVTDRHFQPRALPPGATHPPYTGRLIPVTLLFREEAAFRVYDEFPAEQVKQTKNGLLVETQFPDGDWFVGYILSFGHSAEVMQPAFLRAHMRQLLEDMLKPYLENKEFPET